MDLSLVHLCCGPRNIHILQMGRQRWLLIDCRQLVIPLPLENNRRGQKLSKSSENPQPSPCWAFLCDRADVPNGHFVSRGYLELLIPLVLLLQNFPAHATDKPQLLLWETGHETEILPHMCHLQRSPSHTKCVILHPSHTLSQGRFSFP